MRLGRRGLALGFAALTLVSGCRDPQACSEDARAQVDLPRFSIQIDGAPQEVELATRQVEIERGWKHRQCRREALLLSPEDAPRPLSVWGCGLVDAVDLHFVSEGRVIAVNRGLSPCDEPCNACPSVDSPGEVDFVIESIAGRLGAEVGSTVFGWPER